MAKVPPKAFYKLSAEQQVAHAVIKMNEHYTAAEDWKKIAQRARGSKIVDPDPRPDEGKFKAMKIIYRKLGREKAWGAGPLRGEYY